MDNWSIVSGIENIFSVEAFSQVQERIFFVSPKQADKDKLSITDFNFSTHEMLEGNSDTRKLWIHAVHSSCSRSEDFLASFARAKPMKLHRH